MNSERRREPTTRRGRGGPANENSRRGLPKHPHLEEESHDASQHRRSYEPPPRGQPSGGRDGAGRRSADEGRPCGVRRGHRLHRRTDRRHLHRARPDRPRGGRRAGPGSDPAVGGDDPVPGHRGPRHYGGRGVAPDGRPWAAPPAGRPRRPRHRRRVHARFHGRGADADRARARDDGQPDRGHDVLRGPVAPASSPAFSGPSRPCRSWSRPWSGRRAIPSARPGTPSPRRAAGRSRGPCRKPWTGRTCGCR